MWVKCAIYYKTDIRLLIPPDLSNDMTDEGTYRTTSYAGNCEAVQ